MRFGRRVASGGLVSRLTPARWLSGVGAGLLSGVGAWGSSNENALYDVHRGHDVELRSSLRSDLRPFRPSPKSLKEYRKRLTRGRRLKVDVLRRAIPVVRTPDGLRALSGGRPISPTSVQRYLQDKFGKHLTPARAAMRRLARSVPPKTLAANGYALYVKFRPGVPTGVKGWGAKGNLDLTVIRRLTRPSRSRR